MLKPSERIAEHARALVDEVIKKRAARETEESRRIAQTMGKVFGVSVSEADEAERLLKDPMLWVTATLAYLDEERARG